MEIFLICDKERLRLPILPPSFEVGMEGGHQSVRTDNFGEVTILGERDCLTISFSSFFPARDYAFARYKKDRAPYAYVRKLSSWITKKVRCLITSTNFNRVCVITSFKYGEPDGSGDISYTLSLKEYRKPKPRTIDLGLNGYPPVSMGLGERLSLGLDKYPGRAKGKTGKAINKTYTVKKGDTLKGIAKKLLGDSSYDQLIYKQNKTVIEKAAKAHKKRSSKRKGVPGGWLYEGTKLKINTKI